MLFENKTNSEILAKLQVPKRILSQKQMIRPGWGLDILDALHNVISPEELKLRQKELKLTDNQLNKLFKWLECNCDIFTLMKELDCGYQYSMISIVDNNSWGVLTKIRRYLVNWKPTILPDGSIAYNKLSWLEDPILKFKNEDSKLYHRKGKQIAGWNTGHSPYCYANNSDEWYEKQFFGFQKINGIWQEASKEHTQSILEAFKVMEAMTA